MGLDMYLYAEKHISSYDYVENANGLSRRDNLEYDMVIGASNMDKLPTAEYASVSVRKMVGYWRKANAIHGWFIRECANGVDNCEDIYVSREKLVELRDECMKALADRDKAVPDSKDRVITIKEGSSPEAVVANIMDEWKKQAMNRRESTMVSEPLAPVSGFFFGSTAKDEYYYHTIEYTLDTLNSILANDNKYDYYYRASW